MFADGGEVCVFGAKYGGDSVGSGFDWGLTAFMGLQGFTDEGDGGNLCKLAEFSSGVRYVDIYRTRWAFAVRTKVPGNVVIFTFEQIADFFASFRMSGHQEKSTVFGNSFIANVGIEEGFFFSRPSGGA